jgi:hypothetical protein
MDYVLVIQSIIDIMPLDVVFQSAMPSNTSESTSGEKLTYNPIVGFLLAINANAFDKHQWDRCL